MKKLLLILILAALAYGGYFYYTHGRLPWEPASAQEEEDEKVAAITAEAERLYPTRKQDREAWLGRQLKALEKIGIRQRGIPEDIGDRIRMEAAAKYPMDYVRQQSFIFEQEAAVKAINNALADASLGHDDMKRIMALLDESATGNYLKQSGTINRVLAAYNRMRRKGADIPEKDFKIIMGKAFPKLVSDTPEAERIFDQQYLARHNYLTKTIPEIFGDLRSGIEEKFPDDFVAQLAELDRKVTGEISRGNSYTFGSEYTAPSDLGKEISKKYIYTKAIGDSVFAVYFVEMKGKKVMLFPSDMLDKIGDTFTVDVDGRIVNTSGVFVSGESNMCIATFNSELDVAAVTFEPAKEVLAGYFDVQIVGLDAEGRIRTMPAVLNSGVLEIPKNSEGRIPSYLMRGSLIVSVREKKVLGIFDPNVSGAFDFYIGEKGRNDLELLADDKGISGEIEGIKPVIGRNRAAFSAGANNPRVLYVDDLQTWQKFQASKYAAQKARIKQVCDANYWISRFALLNLYGEAVDSKLIGPVAKRYEKKFASRMQKGAFQNEYSRYLNDITGVFRRETNVDRDYSKNFYFPLKQYADLQFAFVSDLKAFTGTMSFLQKPDSIIHTDLRAHLKENTYAPTDGKGAFGKYNGGGNSSGMNIRMGN